VSLTQQADSQPFSKAIGSGSWPNAVLLPNKTAENNMTDTTRAEQTETNFNKRFMVDPFTQRDSIGHNTGKSYS
jgi:hypothetical protein